MDMSEDKTSSNQTKTADAPTNDEENVPSTLEKTVDTSDNVNNPETAISSAEKALNIDGAEPGEKQQEKHPEQVKTAESHDNENLQLEKTNVDDDDEELELRWDDDELSSGPQNIDGSDISTIPGLKDKTDEIGAGDADDSKEISSEVVVAKEQDLKLIEQHSETDKDDSKLDILVENDDTLESCNDIDMDTEDKLLKDVEDTEIDNVPTSDKSKQPEVDIEAEDNQIAKDTEPLVEKQVSGPDKSEYIATKAVTVMKVDTDINKKEVSVIPLLKNDSKLLEDVSLDTNPDNEESLDISMEMEDSLLKDEDQIDNKKIESTSGDTQLTDIEKAIAALDDDLCNADDIETDIAEKSEVAEKSQAGDENSEVDKKLEVKNKSEVDKKSEVAGKLEVPTKSEMEHIGTKNTALEQTSTVVSNNDTLADDPQDKNTIKEVTTSAETSVQDVSLNDSNLRQNDHALTKPDAMLEIPTQELIDIDDLDESEDTDNTITIQADKSDIKGDISDKDNIEKEKVDNAELVKENIDKVESVQIKESANEWNKNDLDLVAEPKEKEKSSVAKEDRTVKLPEKDQHAIPEDPQPSTSALPPSNMTLEDSDNTPEVSDSLGLLAESSGRVMDDDEEAEDDDEADNEDDFDPEDESSNPMTTAEHSEDSSPHHSDSEAPKDQEEGESPSVNNAAEEFQFEISNVESETAVADVKEMDIDEIECIEDTPDITLTDEIQLLDDDNDDDDNNAVDDDNADAGDNANAGDNAVSGDNADVDDDTIQSTAEGIQDEIKVEQKEELGEVQADIETVKLSDTSDNEDAETAVEVTSDSKETKVDEVVNKGEASPPSSSSQAVPVDETKLSPSKKKLERSQGCDQPIFNIVDLEDSDEEIKVTKTGEEPQKKSQQDSDVTSVNLTNEKEETATSVGSTSDSSVVKSLAIKPTPKESAKAVTSKPKMGLEIFSLDSDEDDHEPPSTAQTQDVKETTPPPKPKTPEPEKPPTKCINPSCRNRTDAPKIIADATVASFYGATKKRKFVCVTCAEVVAKKTQDLIDSMKQFAPLLELCVGKDSQELVEISDSEDEEDTAPDSPTPPEETIGEKAAMLLEENLAGLLNETWFKYRMDERLGQTKSSLDEELSKLDKESKEIDQMLNECQVATDKLRNDLYAAFAQESSELPPIVISDTPTQFFVGPDMSAEKTRQSKRRHVYASDTPGKKVAIPLRHTPSQVEDTVQAVPESAVPAPAVDSPKNDDDDKDVSVVKLSAEAAPSWLPPPGELSRAPLKVGMAVVAIMRNTFGRWLEAKIVEVLPKGSTQFTTCRVKFDHKVKNPCRIVSARGLAYVNPPNARLTIGTRIIALFKDENTGKRESYYSGVVAEIPNPVNSYRYLVFFDDGYAQYVEHNHTRLVCETSTLVWEEVHPFSREFVREYLMAYPERPMVRLHKKQCLRTEWNGKWWNCRVLQVDASLAQVLFIDEGRREWIYRGSTRLAPLFLELKAAERHRQRPMPRSKAQTRSNMPYVEYTRSDEQSSKPQATPPPQTTEDMRRQRAVAKKSTVPVAQPSTSAPSTPNQQNLDTITSRVVYYTPKNAVRPHKMTPHTCGPKCKRTDVLSLKDLRTYNPLAKPLLSGWERQIVRFKGHKEVMYRAPCGRRVRSLRELHFYLRVTHSELPVDLFDFYPGTHCLAEFVLNKCLVGKKDLSHGKENVPVPCVNYYDESLPEFCSYNTDRTPTAGVPLNLDPEFLCGCDCTDDCLDKSKCACWKMTLEGARTIGFEGDDIGYEYRRLPEPLPSGIYECNSRCKCKDTCLNRVAQHPLQLKLQVFKTLNRGWGIRALNDVPKGAFLCVYAGNLLTDATANLDGLNEGDEYLAELDYIEVVEQMKEGYEEDIPEADKRMDKKELAKQKQAQAEEEEEISSSDEENKASKNEMEDDDFRPGFIGLGLTEFSKRLRKRDKAKEEEEKKEERKKDKDGDDCITISDDEEIREPSRFTAQTGMRGDDFVSKYKSVRALFGEDEACYIMDAKVQGNIGRYLNHSCTPNVFVQNVFVDTHDPRFPWVAFFALSHIKAGTELTWNYNYDVGSVPGKVLYCYCGAPNCRGRLL